MEPLSIAATIITLVRAAGSITETCLQLKNNFTQVPVLIDNLLSEYTGVKGVLQQLQDHAERFNPDIRTNVESRQQAIQVFTDTTTTLTRLHEKIRALIWGSSRNGSTSRIGVRFRYMRSERGIESILHQLRARQQSLSLLLNLWSSFDTARIRTDLIGIRASLEGGLRSLHTNHLLAALEQRHNSTAVQDESPPAQTAIPSPQLPETSTLSENDPSEDQQTLCETPTAIYKIRELLRGSHTRQGAPAADAILESIMRLAAAEAATPGLLSDEIAAAAEAVAKLYQHLGQHEEALNYYYQALESREATVGEAHNKSLNTLDNIAENFAIQSKYDEALAHYEESLNRKQRVPALSQEHPSVLATKTKIGRMHHKLGHADEALQQLSDVLQKYRSTIGEKHLSYLAVLSDIAAIHQQHGRSDEALSEYRRVLAGREERYGPDHSSTRETRQAIEAIESQSDNGVEPGLMPQAHRTLEWYHTILAQKERALGKGNPATLAIMFEMAVAYDSHEQFDQAIGWFKQVLVGREKVFGGKHRLTLLTVHEMAGSFARKKEFNTSLAHYQRALTGREESLGNDHPETLTTLFEMANVYAAMDEYRQAIERYQRVVAGRENRLGVNHSSTLIARHNLASVYQKQGKHSQALQMYQQVLALRERTLGALHPSTLSTKHEMADIYSQQANYDMSIDLAKQVLSGREQKFGATHSSVVATRIMLAHAYVNKAANREALECFTKALDGMKKLAGQNGSVLRTTMSNIAAMHERLDQDEQALRWYRQVLESLEKEFGKDHASDTRIFDAIARLCGKLQRLDEALEYLQKALSAKEESLYDDETIQGTLYQLGDTCNKMGMYEQALIWFKRLLSQDKTGDINLRLISYKTMGSILAQQDKFDEAFDVLQQGLDLSKSRLGDEDIVTKRIKEEIALLYLKRDQRNESLAQYQQGLDWVQTELDRDDPLTLTFLCKVASAHYEHHLYNEALSLYLSALEGLERANNANAHEWSEIVLTVTSNVANLQERLGNYDDALEYFNRSLRMRENNSGRTNPDVLEDMHHIASIYVCQSRHEDALHMLQQVQRREETAHGAASPQALATLCRMATIQSRLGNSDVALSNYQRALSGLEIAHGPDHPDVFRTLHSMSGLYIHLGDFDGALAALIRAAEGMVRSLDMGPRDLDTLSTMHDLAFIYDYLERHDEALQWWRNVLEGYRDKLGEGDSRTREASQRVNQGPNGRARGLRD